MNLDADELAIVIAAIGDRITDLSVRSHDKATLHAIIALYAWRDMLLMKHAENLAIQVHIANGMIAHGVHTPQEDKNGEEQD